MRRSTPWPRPSPSPTALGPQGARLAGLAESAFLESMDLSVLVLAASVAIAAAFVALWAPGRDGRQFGFIRRCAVDLTR